MATFTDRKGRKWQLEIYKSLADRIKRDFGIDFLDLKSLGEGLVRLMLTDLEGFFAVLWVLCEEQAESLGITQEQWAEGMGGTYDGADVLDSAMTAIEEAVVTFSPSRERKNILRKAIAATSTLMGQREAELTESYLLEQMSAAVSTNSPQSPASIPKA